ncbi:MAG: putative ABC transporter permease [Firmicutes bacterium]|nr:putative ABC transporter permease [Bacillota bacterium]
MKSFLLEAKRQILEIFGPLWQWATNYTALTLGHKWLAIWLISFLAWVMETVYCSALAGQLVDRGLLLLPFCPIYGLTIGVIDWLIGTPLEGGWLLKRCRLGWERFILYFLLAILIPTVAEFLTGLFFDGLLGVRLWYYEEQPFNLMGYVCLQVSLLWGTLLTGFMLVVYPFIRKVVSLIPRRTATVIAVITSALVVFNLGFFFIRIIPKIF